MGTLHLRNMAHDIKHYELLTMAMLAHISSRYFGDHGEIRMINKCIFRKECSSQGFVVTGAETAADAREIGWTPRPAVICDHTQKCSRAEDPAMKSSQPTRTPTMLCSTSAWT